MNEEVGGTVVFLLTNLMTDLASLFIGAENTVTSNRITGEPDILLHGEGRGSMRAVCSSGRMYTERFLVESQEKSGNGDGDLSRLAWNMR